MCLLILLTILVLWCEFTTSSAAGLLPLNFRWNGGGLPKEAPPTKVSTSRHLNDLNFHPSIQKMMVTVVPHRNADLLFSSHPPISQSVREEMLKYGGSLPLIQLSRTTFPMSRQVLAFPLREPHGQGGPGTTLAIVVKDGTDGFKVLNFGHIAGVHPDVFANYLSSLTETKASFVTTLRKLTPNLKLATLHWLH